MNRKILLLYITFFIPVITFAASSRIWKGFRYELIFGLGSTSFFGELGGANQFGTHAFRDLDWRGTREANTYGIRYRLNEMNSIRTNLSYGRLKGDDKWTQEFYRHNRNLNFKSIIWEYTLVFEKTFMKEQIGRKYRLHGLRGHRGYEIYYNLFAGIGVFHFQPKGYDDSNKKRWYKLQPLHTEGQDYLSPTRKHYHRVALCIPMGLALKYQIKKKWVIGLEYGLRYTFTDYIDDVSTTYVDNKILIENHKDDPEKQILAVKLSNRALEKNNSLTGPGAQRGDPRFLDAYLFSLITISYKLKTTQSNLPKF